MPRTPGPVRRGQKLGADRINAMDAATRAARPVAGPDMLTSAGRDGTSFERGDPDRGNCLGVITAAVGGCTGTLPDFVAGVGEAVLVQSVAADGTMVLSGETVRVYNSTLGSLEVSGLPVQLKQTVYGRLFVDVKDCP